MRFLPFIIFALLSVMLGVGVFAKRDVPLESQMVGKPLPAISINGKLLGALIEENEVTVINFFASWCAPCTIEHPAMIELSSRVVPIIGVAWKNKENDAHRWLGERGNPYRHVVIDLKGESTVALGLTGVPETFILNKKGVVVFHTRQPITLEQMKKEIYPLIEKLEAEE